VTRDYRFEGKSTVSVLAFDIEGKGTKAREGRMGKEGKEIAGEQKRDRAGKGN
jgi:hypothetical protein